MVDLGNGRRRRERSRPEGREHSERVQVDETVAKAEHTAVGRWGRGRRTAGVPGRSGLRGGFPHDGTVGREFVITRAGSSEPGKGGAPASSRAGFTQLPPCAFLRVGEGVAGPQRLPELCFPCRRPSRTAPVPGKSGPHVPWSVRDVGVALPAGRPHRGRPHPEGVQDTRVPCLWSHRPRLCLGSLENPLRSSPLTRSPGIPLSLQGCGDQRTAHTPLKS